MSELKSNEDEVVVGCATIRDFKILTDFNFTSFRMLLSSPAEGTWEVNDVMPDADVGKAFAHLCAVSGVTCSDAIEGRLVRFASRGKPMHDKTCRLLQLGHIVEARYYFFKGETGTQMIHNHLEDAVNGGDLQVMKIADTKLGPMEGGTNKLRLDLSFTVSRDNSHRETATWFLSSLNEIDAILQTLGVKSWEELKNLFVRIRRQGQRRKIVSIGHLFYPNKVVVKPGVDLED